MTKRGAGRVVAAVEEAKRLRAETAAREAGRFAVKTPPTVTDNDDQFMSSELDIVEMRDGGLTPMVNEQLNQIGSSLTGLSIMEEIQMDRLAGKLRPFVEGEPIGACHNGPKRGPAPSLTTHNKIMDERQKELRERQKTNDRTLARLKEKCR